MNMIGACWMRRSLGEPVSALLIDSNNSIGYRSTQKLVKLIPNMIELVLDSINFIGGTDKDGNAQTEVINGANAGTATGIKAFKTVTSITQLPQL